MIPECYMNAIWMLSECYQLVRGCWNRLRYCAQITTLPSRSSVNNLFSAEVLITLEALSLSAGAGSNRTSWSLKWNEAGPLRGTRRGPENGLCWLTRSLSQSERCDSDSRAAAAVLRFKIDDWKHSETALSRRMKEPPKRVGGNSATGSPLEETVRGKRDANTVLPHWSGLFAACR